MGEEWATVFQTPWFSVRKRGHMHVVDERNGKCGAAVLPILSDGEVLLVEQYRASFERHLLEAPRGFARDGESAEDCARRELEEETGIDPATCLLSNVGRIAPNSGLLSTEVNLYLAKFGSSAIEARPGPEIGRLVRIRIPELIERIRQGEIVDGFTIALALHASTTLAG